MLRWVRMDGALSLWGASLEMTWVLLELEVAAHYFVPLIELQCPWQVRLPWLLSL